MLPLPCLDQRDQRIEPIAFRRIAPGVHQSFYLAENAAIVVIGFNRCDNMTEISKTPSLDGDEPEVCGEFRYNRSKYASTISLHSYLHDMRSTKA